MKDRVLVAYATKFGSTREVAQRIGKLIELHSIAADVTNVNLVKDISKYSGVILGTAIRMGKPISEAVTFTRKFKDELNEKPVACFSVGLYMKEDTEENRDKARKCLLPILELLKNPVNVGLFGGKVDYSKMPLLLRWTFSKDKSGQLTEGDWRNWDTIEAWVDEIVPLLYDKVE